MFFFTQIHFPKLSLTDYEKEIEKKILHHFRLSSSKNRYQHQLHLKKHASILADSIHQLKGVSSNNNIILLEEEIRKAVLYCLNTKDYQNTQQLGSLKALQNTFSLVQDEVKADKGDKIISGLCIISNSILFAAGAAGVILFGAATFTGPIGIGFLGLGMALLSAAMLALATYSIYVDSKNLFNKQLKDINKGIDFLINYPSLVRNDSPEPEASNNYQTEGLTV